MSRPLWGESEAGSWTPFLEAGPGCCPPPPLYNYKPNYYLQRRRGEEPWQFSFHLFVCLFTDLSQISPNALCLGLPVTKPEDWDSESLQCTELCLTLKQLPQDHLVLSSPHPTPLRPSFQYRGICSNSGWGSLTEPCTQTSCDPFQTS